jgi:hypothetical protein
MDSLMTPTRASFAMVRAGVLHIFESDAQLDPKLKIVTAIASDGDWIVVGGTALVLFKRGEKVAFLQVYRGTVSAVAVSEVYGVIVAGTNDGSLVIISLRTLSMVRAIDLGNQVPRRVLVTPAWGFIVSYCQEIVCGSVRHSVVVHTINGGFVKRVEIAAQVDAWECWASWDGFDFMVLASGGGKLDVCEVRYLNLKRNQYICQAQIVGVHYAPTYRFIVAVSAAGQLFFVPCALP